MGKKKWKKERKEELYKRKLLKNYSFFFFWLFIRWVQSATINNCHQLQKQFRSTEKAKSGREGTTAKKKND